jgi:small subunit ribosomal protein S26e
MLCRFSRF